tara:strand:- start:484 stop:945 length:462 start_codon:yes stop_codon:yes gene_type:complete
VRFKKPSLRSAISLDVGKKRIGLAYCDALHITVNVLPALKRGLNFSEVSIIKNYIKDLNISGIVIGIPLDDAGKVTDQAKDCIKYGESILKICMKPYVFVNEHSSTWESIDKFGIQKDKSGIVDSLSAKIILEQWIKEGPELREYDSKNQLKY